MKWSYLMAKGEKISECPIYWQAILVINDIHQFSAYYSYIV